MGRRDKGVKFVSVCFSANICSIFTIVKNSANIYEKSCANIYVNIRCAKNSATNCASLIFPQILAQIFAEINSVQKIPQMFAIFLSDRGVPGV